MEIKTKHDQYRMEKTGRGQLIRLSTEKSIQTQKNSKGCVSFKTEKNSITGATLIAKRKQCERGHNA